MQSSLWKLGALLGVIGIGFLVLLKAQNEMAVQTAEPEGFNELAAIDELDTLDSSASQSEAQTQQTPPMSLAEGNLATEPIATTAVGMESPIVEPTVAVDTGAMSVSAEESSADVNPFGNVAAAPTPAEPDQPTESKEPVEESANPNPFAALMSSFTDEASEQPEMASTPETTDTTSAAELSMVEAQTEPTSAEPAIVEPTVAESTTGTLNAAGPTVADPSAFETNQADVALDAEGPGNNEEPGLPEASGEDLSQPQLAALDTFNPFQPAENTSEAEVSPTSQKNSAAEPAIKPFEPTSLTALPPADGGPSLMPPPADTEQDFTTDDLPAQAEPSSLVPAHLAVETGEEETGDQVAQVSGVNPFNTDQPARVEPHPEPNLVFPGASEPASRQPEQPAQSPTPQLTFPESDPKPAGRAWVGDSPAPQNNVRTPHGEEERVVHPDGSVEMTIMPRNGQPQETTFPETSSQAANPFAATGQSQPANRKTEPGRTATAQPQQPFPDPGLSFSKGPIQPSAAAEAAGAGSDLTSADFVGVGTISPDTPSTPQQAQLTIEKQAPSDAALGQELIYSILVRNIGRSAAKNVVVEDLVPKGTELQGTDPQARMTPDKKLVWQLGTMSPGTTRTIRIKVIPTEAGQIGSVATVSFEAAVASRTVITAPQLRLDLNGPQEVRVGEKAPYKFVLTNTGSADASNVYIRNIIPAGFEHPAAQKRNGVTDIEYEVGTLRRGESREVELTLLAVAEGQFQNQAILTADGNVNVESQQPVQVITSRLKIHREGPANRVVGSEARFTNTVSNESSRPLSGVTITETLPVGVKFVQASDGGYYNAQQRQITWQFNTLEAGGVRRLQIVVLAEQAGTLASTITAVDQQGDTAEATSQLTVAGYSSLTVDVTNPARAIPVGEEVALRLKVRNGGTAAANGVETRVQLPPQLKFVSARGPVRYAQQGEWIAFEPIDRIDIQGEQTFDIVLSAASESQDARVVVQLTSAELTRPLSEDESVVIYASGP